MTVVPAAAVTDRIAGTVAGVPPGLFSYLRENDREWRGNAPARPFVFATTDGWELHVEAFFPRLVQFLTQDFRNDQRCIVKRWP